MRNRFWKKGIALVLASAVVLGCGVSAHANEEEVKGTVTGEEVKGTVTDEEVKGIVTEEEDGDSAAEEITVDEGDKPFLSLGADLSEKDRKTVLDLLGVSEEDLDDYDVIEVTNEQEHEYLDSYIPKEKIGKRALSSVVVMEGEKGSGIRVSTKNITYCTTGMYENALATAGLEDAEVIVAGPFDISGTAALLGAIEAYSVMTGDEVDTDIIDGAVNEIVTTGELAESTGESDEVEGMVAYMKEQIAGRDLSEEEISDVIDQAAEKFDVSLTSDQRTELLSLLQKLQGLDLNWDSIRDQAQNVYDRLKGLGINVDTEELANQAKGFFARIIEFFKKLFGL